MATFHLPDLGEGLSDAEVLKWHVAVGEQVLVDQALVSVETAKAVVEVPAPQSGRISLLHVAAGQRLATGTPLVDFADEPGAADTVVGRMPTHGMRFATDLMPEAPAAAVQRIQAVPAARALARSLGVELSTLKGSGSGGVITLEDVIAAGLPAAAQSAGRGSTMRPATPLPARALTGEVQELRSLRRAMAQSMTLSRDSVMECTVFDDADLHSWGQGGDYTARVLRAIASACRLEPGLNAWFDSGTQARQLFTQVDVGLAVDTQDGLLVPVMRNVGTLDAAQLRCELQRLKDAALNRTVKSEELRHFTFMLSNFGMLAGRYATPVVVPPAVAILGTGRARADVVAVADRVEIHQRMPLSLTFDHRVVTGGEAVRFLGALIRDLELPQ